MKTQIKDALEFELIRREEIQYLTISEQDKIINLRDYQNPIF